MSLLAALPLLLAQGIPDAAAADARAIAETGALVTVGDLATARETQDTLAAHPEWTAAERASFKTAADETAAALRERAIAAVSAAYLAALTPAQLRDIAAFTRSPAAQAQKAAQPRVMAETMKALAAGGSIDFMGDVRKAMCARTGKLCEAQ